MATAARKASGHHQHQRIGVLLEQKGCDTSRGRRIAPLRLDDDGLGLDTHGAQLLGDNEAVRIVADDDRRLNLIGGARGLPEAQRRFLQEAAFGGQRL